MTEKSDPGYSFTYINYQTIADMLYDDTEYIIEFAEAAIQSFEEFSTHYRERLLVKDETLFRKAGHKIKPITQMLGIEVIIEEYEHGKELIYKDADKQELVSSSERIEKIVSKVVKDLETVCKKAE